jgi:hypothetical protein
MPPDGILRDIWYFEGSDHMNFLSGEVADGDVSLAGIAKDVLKYANQKAVA